MFSCKMVKKGLRLNSYSNATQKNFIFSKGASYFPYIGIFGSQSNYAKANIDANVYPINSKKT